MAVSQSVTEVKVEDYVFPPTAKAPGSDKPFFLGGAGVREIEIPGKFIKVTAIAVYLEECAISSLAPKWKGKIADELVESDEFFRDIVTGPFEKFVRVTLILPLTGQQYSEKVIENCVKAWKSHGVYTDEEAKAIEKFSETFKDENFPPGNSVMFTQSPLGTLTIAFSKRDSTPESGIAVIENKKMAEAVIESTIGKHGVSPEAKQSLANRLSKLLNKNNDILTKSNDMLNNNNDILTKNNDKVKTNANMEATNYKLKVLEGGLGSLLPNGGPK